MNASVLPVPKTRHGCPCILWRLGQRSYLRHGLPRNAKSGAAASMPRSGSQWQVAEITKQLSVIGLNESSCREGEREAKQQEVEGCKFGESREEGEGKKGTTSKN